MSDQADSNIQEFSDKPKDFLTNDLR